MKKRAILEPLIRTIAFLLCAAVVYGGIVSVVGHSNTQISWIHAYRARDALQIRSDSLDVIAVGASPNIAGFSPMEAYQEYGFTSFSAGVGHASGFDCYYLLLTEMLKTQRPSVVLIEMSQLYSASNKVGFQVVSDAVGFSMDKVRLLNELPEDYLVDSCLSYILPILKYHTRYKNITKDDFFDAVSANYYDYFQGFKALHIISEVKEYPMMEKSESVQFNDTQLYYLEKIVDLCRNRGITPVLYSMPYGTWSKEKHEVLNEYAWMNGLDYVDLNLPDAAQDMGIDTSRDFTDISHVNFSGAIKATRYIGRYLCKNFDLPDRRGDPAYAYLEQELERYVREKFNEELIRTTDLSSYLDLLLEMDGGYTVIISAKDSAANGLSEELLEKLKNIGFQSDLTPGNAYRHGLIGVYQDGQMVYEDFSEGIDNSERDVLEFRSSLPDGKKYYVKSAGWSVGSASSIVIDGVEKSKSGRGLNLVVYDSIGGRVVDSIVFDTHADAGITYKR